MIREEDQVFAKVVARHNLVSPQSIAEGLEALQLDDRRRLKEVFLDRGLLTRAQVDELERVASRVMQGGPIPGYEIVQRLGKGAMGAVYRAHQLSAPGRTVALKVVRRPVGKDRRAARRLLQEARIASRLDHPHIVKGYDVGVARGYYYFAMELVEGDSLRELLARRRFSPAEALGIVRQIAGALEHAHRFGIIHRDVKPGNILLSPGGTAKLTDLGLAKGPAGSTLTRSGATLGTPQYISPEQARAPRDADARSDIYSLGATLYHMVTGVPPYQGDTLASVISQVLFEAYVPPADLRGDLDPAITRLIDKMMVKDPERRYPDAGALVRDLDAVLAGREIDPLPERGAAAPDGEAGPDREGGGAGAGAGAGGRHGPWVAAGLVGVAALVLVFLASRRPVGEGSGAAPGGGDRAPSAAARELGRLEERYPVQRVPPGEILEALDGYRHFALAYPGGEAEAEARERLASLEHRFRGFVRDAFAELAGQAEAQLVEGRYGEALHTLPGGEAALLEERFGRDPEGVPSRYRGIFEKERERREGDLARRISSRVRAELLAALGDAVRRRDGAEGEGSGYRGVREALDRLGKRLDGVRGFLLAQDAAAVAAALSGAREGLREGWGSWILGELGRIEGVISEKRFASAARRLEDLSRRPTPWEWLGAAGARDRIQERIRGGEAKAVAGARREYAAWLQGYRGRVARREYAEALGEAEALRASLERRCREVPGLGELRERAAVLAGAVREIQGVFERVRADLASDVGRRVKLPLLEDRNEKLLTAVEGDRITYRYQAGGGERTASVLDLARDEVVERGAPRAGREGDCIGLAWFLLGEAWGGEGGGPARERLLDEAEGFFGRGESAWREHGRDPGGAVFASLVGALRRQELAAAAERRRRAREAAGAGDARFDAGDWKGALEAYGRAVAAPLRPGLAPAERERVEGRIARCRRKIEGDRIRASLRGKVEILDELRWYVRVVYDFDDPLELEDWEHNRRHWRVQGGALILDEPATDFAQKLGIRHKARFDILSDLKLEVVLLTDAGRSPLFLAFSFFGNHFGILNLDAGAIRQMNLFKGSLADYEAHFLWPGRRGFRRPVGLDDDAPRLQAGRAYTLDFEFVDHARTFRFFLDGVRRYERKGFDNPAREGVLEIRTWFPQRIDRVVIEGRLQR